MAEICIEDGKVTGVITDRGKITTDKVVLATGPFAIKAGNQIIGGTLGAEGNLSDLIQVRKRQRFSGVVSGLPSGTHIFVVAPGGQFARLHTDKDKDSQGYGDYGFANPDDPPVDDPVLHPSATEIEFPALVYAGLGRVISGYGDEERTGPMVGPIIEGSRIAGWYADTKDDIPVVCATSIRGLFLNIGHSHLGVMVRGAADHMANIIFNGESPDNPFSLNRDFVGQGIRL
jgi:glycine/D-amino acid oxidase-like deaminating enzyme